MQINYGYCGNPVLPSDSNFLARCTTQYRTVFSSPIRIARIDLPRFRHAVYRRCIPSSSSSWIRWFGGIVERILIIHPPPLANTDSNETTGCASVVVLKHAVTIVPAYCKRADIISQRLRWKISIAGLRSLAAIKTEEK